MVILVPWKPVALVLGLLSALILISYFGSALMRGKDPFAVNTGNWQTTAAHPGSAHSNVDHKRIRHVPVTANR